MSVSNLRDISLRYARGGRNEDMDAFRQEINRVDRKRRRQTLDRYIQDMLKNYGYIVRNRYYQYVPVRNHRLTELIERAVAEQRALNAQLQSQNDALQQKLDEDEEQDLAEFERKLEEMKDEEEKASQKSDTFDIMSYLPYILSFVGAILVALVVTLVYAIVRLSDRPVATTVVTKSDDLRDDSVSE